MKLVEAQDNAVDQLDTDDDSYSWHDIGRICFVISRLRDSKKEVNQELANRLESQLNWHMSKCPAIHN